MRTVAAAVAALVIGIVSGYINIQYITWLQKRTPAAMIGRMMSLVMFASIGLSPISHALSGTILELSPLALFGGAGVLLTGVALVTLLSPAARSLSAPGERN